MSVEGIAVVAMSTEDAAATDLGKPPSYDDLDFQPTILVLAGQSIHAESADTETLYKMNRGISSLTHATQQVDFEGVERAVRTTVNDEPTIKTRDRLIYILRHQKSTPGGLEPLPSDSPPYYIEAVSSRTRPVGNLGLKRSRFRKHWKVLPVDISGKNSKWKLPQFLKDSGPMFEIKYNKDRYEWMDRGGKAVAIEDELDNQHRLIITASLPRQVVDVLVAMWCCRMWEYSAEHTKRVEEGMEGGESALTETWVDTNDCTSTNTR